MLQMLAFIWPKFYFLDIYTTCDKKSGFLCNFSLTVREKTFVTPTYVINLHRSCYIFLKIFKPTNLICYNAFFLYCYGYRISFFYELIRSLNIYNIIWGGRVCAICPGKSLRGRFYDKIQRKLIVVYLLYWIFGIIISGNNSLNTYTFLALKRLF